MAYFVFVDNSNVWIEGKFASAVKQGWASSTYEAHAMKAEDTAWRLDFGKLLSFVTNDNLQEIKRAVLFGSKPPLHDSLWAAMGQKFEVTALDRNYANKEKAIDTGIVQQISKSLYRDAEEGDIFVLVMGDKDFLPSIQAIHEENCLCHVAFWDNASGELVGEADQFIDLTPNIEVITH